MGEIKSSAWDNKINKNTDWGGDESTGGLPVKGNRVQEFIKNSINNVGSGFYNVNVKHPIEGEYTIDTAVEALINDENLTPEDKVSLILTYWNNDDQKWVNYKYQLKDYDEEAFADLNNWKELEGAGDGGMQHTCVVSITSPQIQYVSGNATGNFIKFRVTISDRSGNSTGEIANCEINITKANGDVASIKRQTSLGTEVTVMLDTYLGKGQNNIQIKAVGMSTGTIGYNSAAVTVIELNLDSDFDLSNVWENALTIPYSLQGAGVKSVEFYIDGVKQNAATDTVAASAVENTKVISLAGVQGGMHSLQILAKLNDVSIGEFYSETLYFDFFKSGYGLAGNYISVGLRLPEGTVVAPLATPTIDVKQFAAYTVKMASYCSDEGAQTVEIFEGSLLRNEIALTNGNAVSYTNIAKIAGQVRLLLISDRDANRTVNLNVADSNTGLVEITDNMSLLLSAVGRTNNDNNKHVWQYKDINNVVTTTTFNNVPFNATCGWVQGKYLLLAGGGTIEVNKQILSSGAVDTGKTIELEFQTGNIFDENAIVASATADMADGTKKGLIVRASSVSLVSNNKATVETKFKANENVHVAIVIHATDDVLRPRLVSLYVNGIHSGATSYNIGDNFTVQNNFTLGSVDADLYIKTIRVYEKALSDDEVLNNYIIDRDSSAELLEVYHRNDIFTTEGFVNQQEAINQVPIMTLIGDVDVLVAANNKNDSVRVGVDYKEVADPTKNFTQSNVKLKLQGTSSLTYPRKNFKFTLNEGYKMRDNSFAAKTYCLKADFAESSGTHNTGVAKMWNDILVSAGLLTESQKAYRDYCIANDIPTEERKDVRTTVDGKPILLFWRKTEGAAPEFLGKYNFNTDKAAEETFGFRDIPGWDDGTVHDETPSECWEFLDNTNPIALFKTVANFDTAWEDAFERRFPDDDSEPDVTELKKLCTWLVSVDPNADGLSSSDIHDRKERFKAEVSNWFDVDYLCAYYLYTEFFGAVDQRVKNAMLATYGWNASHTNKIWRFINYDNDTINGVRNDGRLMYDYTIDDDSVDPSINSYVYAGHNSTLWTLVRSEMKDYNGINKLADVARRLGSADYSLSYRTAINMFNVEQMGAWCEKIYNKDAEYKYVQPHYDGSSYLYSLQGARAEHRKWWLYNRFATLNSKYSSGDFKNNYFIFLAANAPAGTEFSVVPDIKMYLSWGFNNNVSQASQLLMAGDNATFAFDVEAQIGNNASIYGGSYLREIDLHDMAQYLSKIDASSIGDENALLKLVAGNINVINTGVRNDSFGIAKATKLQYLDVRGLHELTAVDLVNMTKLEELYMENSGIMAPVFADSVPLRVLHYGNRVTAITLNGATNLTTQGLTVQDYSNIERVDIQNCPLLNTQPLVEGWTQTVDDFSDCHVRIDNIDWTGFSEANLMKLVNAASCSLKGRIALTSLTVANKELLLEKFGNIDDEDNLLYVDYPASVSLTSNVNSIIGNSGNVIITAFCSKNGNSVVFNLNERGGNMFSITSEGPVVVNTSNNTVSQQFRCTTTYFNANLAQFGCTVTVDGVPSMTVAIINILKTTAVTLEAMTLQSTNTEVSTSDSTKYYLSNAAVREVTFSAIPMMSSGATTWLDENGRNTSTDSFEFEWTLRTGAANLYGVLAEEVGTGVDTYYRVYMVNKYGEEIEIASMPKYSDVFAQNTLTIVNHTNTVDEDIIDATRNIEVYAKAVVTNRFANDVTSYTVKLCLHKLFFAVQAFDANEPNYNPAVCIVLQQHGVLDRTRLYTDGGNIYIAPNGRRGLCMTMDEALAVTQFGTYCGIDTVPADWEAFHLQDTTYTWFQGLTFLHPTQLSDCVDDLGQNAESYPFDHFDELRFFENLDNYFRSARGQTRNCYCSFGYCYELVSLRLPKTWKAVGNSYGMPYGSNYETYEGDSTGYGGYASYEFCAECSKLQYVDLANVEIIHGYSFRDCPLLNFNILPSSLRVINHSFYNCSSLALHTLPENLKIVRVDAFSNTACDFNALPDSVECVYQQQGMNSMVSLSINSGIKIFEGFLNCANLESYSYKDALPANMTVFPGIKQCPKFNDFMGQGMVLNANNVPSSVIQFGQHIAPFTGSAFSQSNLTSVDLGHLTWSGNYAVAYFYGCTQLTNVVMPKGTYSFSRSYDGGYIGLFENCSNLTTVTFPQEAHVSGLPYGFYNCAKLETINNIDGIVDFMHSDDQCSVFGYCSSLNLDHLPSTISYIPAYCFKNCTSLTSFTIPPLVTQLSRGAFLYCQNLRFFDFNNVTDATGVGDNVIHNAYNMEEVRMPNIKNMNQWVVTLQDNTTNGENFCIFKIGEKLKTISGIDCLKNYNNSKIYLDTSIPPILTGTFVHPKTVPIVVGKGVSEEEDNAIKAAYQSATNWNQYNIITKYEDDQNNV